MHLVPLSAHHPLKSTILVEGKLLCVEVDTGVSVSLVSQTMFKELCPGDIAPIVHPY